MSNTIYMTGRATGDFELRWTSAGKAVGTMSLAMNHRKKVNGEWVDDGATFLRVTVWDHQAEECADRITKGTLVTVSGELRQRDWEKDGEKRTSFEVTARDVSIPVPKYAPRGQGDFSQQSGGFQRPSQQPVDDPWGSAPQQFEPADSEPPF